MTNQRASNGPKVYSKEQIMGVDGKGSRQSIGIGIRKKEDFEFLQKIF